MWKSVRCISNVLVLCLCLCQAAQGSNLNYSGKNNIWDNPFVAFGFDPKTNTLSGYVVALRTAPGRTDECKLVFGGNYGKSNTLSVQYLSEDIGNNNLRKTKASLVVAQEGSDSFLKFRKNSLGGDCDWILPFVGEPRVRESTDEVSVSIGEASVGRWIGVYAVKSAKARFHRLPEDSSVQKAFLVRGDVVFVFDEQGDWYYVEFDSKRRKTVGWIRKSDTVQP